MSRDFKGRVAIVTGAGGGLGREHALALTLKRQSVWRRALQKWPRARVRSCRKAGPPREPTRWPGRWRKLATQAVHARRAEGGKTRP